MGDLRAVIANVQDPIVARISAIVTIGGVVANERTIWSKFGDYRMLANDTATIEAAIKEDKRIAAVKRKEYKSTAKKKGKKIAKQALEKVNAKGYLLYPEHLRGALDASFQQTVDEDGNIDPYTLLPSPEKIIPDIPFGETALSTLEAYRIRDVLPE